MSFSSQFDKSLREKSPLLRGFELLLDPMENGALESLAARSSAVTRRHFGKTMRLFAPLYLSNECINSCTYCGFSRENAIQRVTLELDQVETEARHLTVKGKIVPDSGGDAATEQFSISDDRDARSIENLLTQLGLDPVWKDWDSGILGAA